MEKSTGHNLGKSFEYDTQELSEMVDNNRGWLATQLVEVDGLGDELEDLFLAFSWEAINRCKDREDIAEYFSVTYYMTVALVDVLFQRHPELVAAMHKHQDQTLSELESIRVDFEDRYTR